MRRYMKATLLAPLSVERRRLVYELAEEFPDATPEELTRMANEERAEGEPYYQAARVREWVSDPDRYSPFVDEIAVERGLAFDWAVILRMTPLELDVLAHRLAEMDDPFEAEEQQRASTHLDEFRGGVWGEPEEPAVVSIRRQAWESGPKDWRQWLRIAVQRRRKAAREAAERGAA